MERSNRADHNTKLAAEGPRDWFIAAIEASGTVSECLGAVVDELGYRRDFILAVRQSLNSGNPRGIDAVTDLGQRIKALENTLRFRLGILRPERPAAWFRAPATVSSGPFSTTMIAEPVFNGYEPAAFEQVKEALQTCWSQGHLKDLPFADSEPSLWRTLLSYNQEIHRVAQLPIPFESLRLDVLPDDLPGSLDSRALRAFLLNVRNEILATKERLKACFDELWLASERFWTFQATQVKNAHNSGFGRTNPDADKMRAEFRRRRQETQKQATLLTTKDIEALRFMGFNEYPATEALRQRYLQLAKTYHPDRPGGNDHAFKQLTRAYTHLSQRVEVVSR